MLPVGSPCFPYFRRQHLKVHSMDQWVHLTASEMFVPGLRLSPQPGVLSLGCPDARRTWSQTRTKHGQRKIYIQKELDNSERGSCNILELPCLAKIPQLGIWYYCIEVSTGDIAGHRSVIPQMHLYLPASVSRIRSVDDVCHNFAGKQSNVRELPFILW